MPYYPARRQERVTEQLNPYIRTGWHTEFQIRLAGAACWRWRVMAIRYMAAPVTSA